jgi:hypothetical protein
LERRPLSSLEWNKIVISLMPPQALDVGALSISVGPAAFYFRQRYGSLDWRKISKVNVDDLVREVDLPVLQGLLDDVTFSRITEEELPKTGSDELSVRLIRICQLIIEYQLHCQEAQEAGLRSLVKQLQHANASVESLREELSFSQKDCRSLRRDVLQYQAAMTTCTRLLRQYGIDAEPLFAQLSAAPPLSFLAASLSAGIAPSSQAAQAATCVECGKVFSDKEYLEKHVKRRHRGFTQEKKMDATDDAAVEEAARRLADLASQSKLEQERRKHQEEISALRREMALLRAQVSRPKSKSPPPPVRRVDDEASRRRRVHRILQLRRVLTKTSRRSDPRAHMATAFRRWIRSLPYLQPPPQPRRILQSKRTSFSSRGTSSMAVASSPPRQRGMSLHEMLQAVHRRVELAVESKCGVQGTEGGSGLEHSVELSSGRILPSHFRLDPRDVEAARGEALSELYAKGAAMGLDLQRMKRMDDDTYNRKLAEAAIRRDRALTEGVRVEMDDVERDVALLQSRYRGSVATASMDAGGMTHRFPWDESLGRATYSPVGRVSQEPSPGSRGQSQSQTFFPAPSPASLTRSSSRRASVTGAIGFDRAFYEGSAAAAPTGRRGSVHAAHAASEAAQKMFSPDRSRRSSSPPLLHGSVTIGRSSSASPLRRRSLVGDTELRPGDSINRSRRGSVVQGESPVSPTGMAGMERRHSTANVITATSTGVSSPQRRGSLVQAETAFSPQSIHSASPQRRGSASPLERRRGIASPLERRRSSVSPPQRESLAEEAALRPGGSTARSLAGDTELRPGDSINRSRRGSLVQGESPVSPTGMAAVGRRQSKDPTSTATTGLGSPQRRGSYLDPVSPPETRGGTSRRGSLVQAEQSISPQSIHSGSPQRRGSLSPPSITRLSPSKRDSGKGDSPESIKSGGGLRRRSSTSLSPPAAHSPPRRGSLSQPVTHLPPEGVTSASPQRRVSVDQGSHPPAQMSADGPGVPGEDTVVSPMETMLSPCSPSRPERKRGIVSGIQGVGGDGPALASNIVASHQRHSVEAHGQLHGQHVLSTEEVVEFTLDELEVEELT